MNLETNNPSSNKIQVGTANKVWLITSGGVSNIPTTKQPIITYGLALDKLSLEARPLQIIARINIGISKAKPKANRIVITKSRYWDMSVITLISEGADVMKNEKINGNTR